MMTIGSTSFVSIIVIVIRRCVLALMLHTSRPR